jgi:hypothetical protein
MECDEKNPTLSEITVSHAIKQNNLVLMVCKVFVFFVSRKYGSFMIGRLIFFVLLRVSYLGIRYGGARL